LACDLTPDTSEVGRLCKIQKGCTRLAATSDKVYQLLAHGRCFSPDTPASSITKTGRHDIAEILLKVKKPEYPERSTDHEQATGKLYHLWLRVECILFCNLQSRARTHAILVIGMYELLDNGICYI
jgi:hypothetical protein